MKARMIIKTGIRSGLGNRCETVRVVRVRKTIRTGIRSGLGNNRCDTFSSRSHPPVSRK